MPKRLYVIERSDNKSERLVRAHFKHMAERHVSQQLIKGRIATKDDIERLIMAGVRPEDAAEEATSEE